MTEPRTYEVVALTVPIAYNDHGDHDARGTVLALAEHADELRAATGDRPDPLVRPLVLRACVGDRVVVWFRNELEHRAGIHPQGVRYDVERADGGVVGCNPDSAADPGGRRRYVWDCEQEGVFHLGDLADLRGCADGSQAHGLFGALVVEPAGSTWTDPETGAALRDGLYADVHVPGGPGFREHVTFLQDAAPNDAVPGTAVALASYRCEPSTRRRAAYERLMEAGRLDPVRDAVADEEQRHSSWLHGDPATPVLRAYAGDRTRIRVVHAGLRGSHVFHLHAHRWRAVAGDERSPIVDATGIGPQEAVTIEPVGGAGSAHRAPGDALWEFPGTDLWGVLRVFDTAQDGTGRYPDGTPIRGVAAAVRPPRAPGSDAGASGVPGVRRGRPPGTVPASTSDTVVAAGYRPGTLRHRARRVLRGPAAGGGVHQGRATGCAGAPLPPDGPAERDPVPPRRARLPPRRRRRALRTRRRRRAGGRRRGVPGAGGDR